VSMPGETYQQRRLRQEMEVAKSVLSRLERLRSLMRYSVGLALGGLFGSLILGPMGLIPEATAWGVGITAPVVLGGIAIGLGCYMEDMFSERDVVKLRHDVENATEAYYASLGE
jgi:hypothetical protein